MESSYTIGKIAELSGCAVQTVRYYEQVGLLPKAARSPSNRRRFGAKDLERLQFIRHGRGLGFSLDAIRQLLQLADHPEQPCDQIDRIARGQLEDVTQRIAQLRALQGELERMLAECRRGTVDACHVLRVLRDASHAHPRLPAQVT